ncbi:hypothetical protein H0S73_25020 [Microvirga sp. Marseille-Q2068]|uniref:Chitinase n=1 Tax=Microvirga mediterraneensis TaxID=2754695 RepID=A0A838BW61_9HYPH|nr:hypothetical protein [Microvirga mediterraneensis]
MDRAKFFAAVRGSLFGGKLTEKQVQGMDAMLDAIPAGMAPDHLAYCFATAFHETGAKMQPVVENLTYTSAARIRDVWPTRFPSIASAQMYVRKPQELANKVYGARMGNLGGNDGWTYRGRGFAQITGRDNYKRAGNMLGVDLLTFPELAEEPETAAAIMYCGMVNGWFTGKKLADYFERGVAADPYSARKIINGLDEAAKIAGYYRAFAAALKAAGYVPMPTIPVIDAVPPPPDVEPVEPVPAKVSLANKLQRLLEALFGRKSA